MHIHRCLSFLLVLVLVCVSAAPALAQQMPQVDLAPPANRWVPLGVAIVLTAGILVGSFLSSRRGHRD